MIQSGNATELIGNAVTPYPMLEQLVGGGMGVVYEAENLKPRHAQWLRFPWNGSCGCATKDFHNLREFFTVLVLDVFLDGELLKEYSCIVDETPRCIPCSFLSNVRAEPHHEPTFWWLSTCEVTAFTQPRMALYSKP
jgi:hypothetical protein